jgi:hypothetical protein
MDILDDVDALDQACIFRRLLVPRLVGLAFLALMVETVVPGFSRAARIGSAALFLLPAAIAWAAERRLRYRVKKVIKSS